MSYIRFAQKESVRLGLLLTIIALTMALTGGKTLNLQTGRSVDYSFSHLLVRRSNTVAGSSALQFSVTNYAVNEGDGKATLTVNRSGDTSGVGSVDYATNLGAAPASCGTNNGIASEACDYTMTVGTLQFAANETAKTIAIFINDDTYAEGTEMFTVTLSNPTNGSTIGTPGTTTVTITDNDAVNGQSLIMNGASFSNSFFVRQQYIDFLNREPDAGGLAFWKNELDECENVPLPSGFTDAQNCREVRRINVSAAFFLSIEFQNTGYLVYRFNQAAFNLGPTLQFRSFLKDTQEIQRGVVVGQGNWQQQIEDNKVAFAITFVARSDFLVAFPVNMSAAAFVDALNTNTKDPSNPTTGSLTQTERDNLVATLSADPTSVNLRAQVLRSVAENSVFQQRENSRAFVLMQYFGYLRRNPNALPDTDFGGYNFWLGKLNQFNGDFINAELVKAFITSGEYINRFGQVGVSAILTPEQRLAALEAVRVKFESLSGNQDRNAVNQAILDFIRSRPEFVDSGLSEDFCVWATYSDGVELIVVNNQDAPPAGPQLPQGTQLVSHSPKPANVPDSAKARLTFAFGPSFDNPVPELRTWLDDENYSQPINEGASVDLLKQVGGDGVFYLAGHGGIGTVNFFAVTTDTEPTPTLDKAYEADLKPDALGVRRLSYMIASYSFGGLIDKKTYAFGADFIRKYWGNFGPNSFLFNAACSGGGPGAADFRAALAEKHLSVYAGWTKPVENTMDFNTARFVFDRLLGANKVYVEGDGFKQRPFDYQSVAEDLKLHGLGKDIYPQFGGELKFFPLSAAPNSDGFQLLAPSIFLGSTHEYENQLEIVGNFGQDPGNRGAVFVGAQQCHVSSWIEGPFGSIVCDLPVSGAGSAGEVIVTVDQHKSNPATLSEWEGNFTHTVTGLGTLKQTAIYHVRFRADIRYTRLGVHQVPTMLPRGFFATEDSLFSYQNNGSYTSFDSQGNPLCIETWSGSGSFQRGQQIADRLFRLLGTFNNDQKFSAQLSVQSLGLIRTTECNDGSHQSVNENLISPKTSENTFDLVLDSSLNILGDTKTFTDTNNRFHTLHWDTIQVKYPPKPDSPR